MIEDNLQIEKINELKEAFEMFDRDKDGIGDIEYKNFRQTIFEVINYVDTVRGIQE